MHLVEADQPVERKNGVFCRIPDPIRIQRADEVREATFPSLNVLPQRSHARQALAFGPLAESRRGQHKRLSRRVAATTHRA